MRRSLRKGELWGIGAEGGGGGMYSCGCSSTTVSANSSIDLKYSCCCLRKSDNSARWCLVNDLLYSFWDCAYLIVLSFLWFSYAVSSVGGCFCVLLFIICLCWWLGWWLWWSVFLGFFFYCWCFSGFGIDYWFIVLLLFCCSFSFVNNNLIIILNCVPIIQWGVMMIVNTLNSYFVCWLQ